MTTPDKTHQTVTPDQGAAPQGPQERPAAPRSSRAPQATPEAATGEPKTLPGASGADTANPPRTNAPDRVNGDGSTTIKVERACNGCGTLLGDLDGRDVDNDGNLTDVRGECEHCRPLVALEAAGCTTWELIPREFSRVADEIDRLRPWVFTKGYWQEVDGKLQVVGLRVGTGETRVVAYFGDWLIRRPDGTFTVHKAPVAVTA